MAAEVGLVRVLAMGQGKGSQRGHKGDKGDIYGTNGPRAVRCYLVARVVIGEVKRAIDGHLAKGFGIVAVMASSVIRFANSV